ncbi:hypothetical protein ACN4EE_22340 [Geminocystis sp. CENA526]|uniref:hypothetical protein n=1 Tax=Geminocystis sp. CENA526 TaxID=1355871 RepID=UPI003D6EB8B7
MNRKEQIYAKLREESKELRKKQELEMLKKLHLITMFLFDYVFALYVTKKETQEYWGPKVLEIKSLYKNEVLFHQFDCLLREYRVKMYRDCFEKALSLESEFFQKLKDKWFEGKYSYVDIVKRRFNDLFIIIYDLEYDSYFSLLEDKETKNNKKILEKIYSNSYIYEVHKTSPLIKILRTEALTTNQLKIIFGDVYRTD